MSEKNLEKMAALCRKIEIMSMQIGTMKHDGTNQHSRYSYTSNESMMSAIRSNLSSNGLSIIPSVVDVNETEFKNANGKLTIRSIVTMRFEIVDTETGYSITEQFVGAENDTGGKSLQQAVTQCNKYFLFKLFKVSSKDETDGDEKTVEVKQRFNDEIDNDAKQWLSPDHEKWNNVVAWIARGNNPSEVRRKYKISRDNYSKMVDDAQTISETLND